MKWIFIIAIGFICIAFLVILFLYVWYMPWYVIVLYFVWVVSSIASIVFANAKDKKWDERLTISILLTFGYTVVFVSSIDTEHYMFDEGIGFWGVAPILNLPAFCFIGNWIRVKIDHWKIQKRQAYVNEIKQEIKVCEEDIQSLQMQLKNNVVIIHLLALLEKCGSDVSALTDNPKVNNIAKLNDEIHRKRNYVAFLNEKLRNRVE